MAVFTVNGKTVTAEKNQKLLRFLRDELRLTSVKDGCSEGACGTCTVLIDGKPTKACVPQTDKLEGKTILTVEGLSDWEKEVYTWAFGEAGAVQCGFCIPGMVISAKALLDTNPDPSREEAAFAIRNNICRCTGYVKIIDGILLAAKCFREGKLPEAPADWKVGSRVHRVDVEEKVTGTGQYPDDIYLDGMLYGSAVRSQYPRARVLAIHTEEAKALPGVVCVLTAADIPGINKVGHLKKDWDTMIAVGDITHYLGDAICLVAAKTPEALAQAKALVKVDYEELPAVHNPQEAILPDAPLVHREGKLHIFAGASCIGQGLGTVLTQTVCGETGIPRENVVYERSNTWIAPDSGTTSGSRQTLFTGEACIRACQDLKKALEGKSLADLEGQEFYGEYLGKTDPLGADVPNPVSHIAYGYATQLCVLDKDTGRIKQMVAAHDVGKAVNPLSVEGQIEGGVVMSMGYALTERYPIDENCRPTVKFGTLGLFRANQIPEITPIIVEKPGLNVGGGAIGIGEITSIPTAPAIAEAYRRYDGELRTELPLKNTPYAKK